MNTLQQVKHWADCGWNQHDVAQALGLTRYKLQVFLRQYPDYKWPRARSIAQRQRAAAWRPVGNPANSDRLSAARYAALPRYAVRGVIGTRKELIDKFALVPRHTVDVRLSRGWTLEQALFTPLRKRPIPEHPWHGHSEAS